MNNKTLKDKIKSVVNTEIFKNLAFATLIAGDIALYSYLGCKSDKGIVGNSSSYSAVEIDNAHKYNPNPSICPKDDNPHHFSN